MTFWVNVGIIAKEFIFPYAQRQKNYSANKFIVQLWECIEKQNHSCLRLFEFIMKRNQKVSAIALVFLILWWLLRPFGFLDHIKLAYAELLAVYGICTESRICYSPGRNVPSHSEIYRGMMQTNLHLFIRVHALVTSPAKALLGSCMEKMIGWSGFWLDFILLCGESLYISLPAGMACMVGSCLNWEMDFNELQFLMLSWIFSSHRLN
jgi:hypothetical protein